MKDYKELYEVTLRENLALKKLLDRAHGRIDELKNQLVLITPVYQEPNSYDVWHKKALEDVQYMIDNDQPIRLGD